MGFRCMQCRNNIEASPVRRVIERRPAEYRSRSYKVKKEPQHDPGGIGWEIVKEQDWCVACVKRAEENV